MYDRLINQHMSELTELELAHPFLASDTILREFVSSWEKHTLPKAEWTHAAHIAVCAFYTAALGSEEALQRMREGIPLYNVASGGQNSEDSGYHETLTCFWAAIIRDFIAASQFPTTFAAVQATVLRYGQQRKLHEAFYSFDVVNDRRARREWLPPDTAPSNRIGAGSVSGLVSHDGFTRYHCKT